MRAIEQVVDFIFEYLFNISKHNDWIGVILDICALRSYFASSPRKRKKEHFCYRGADFQYTTLKRAQILAPVDIGFSVFFGPNNVID